MKILVTGSKGQLGRELISQGKQFNFEILSFDLPELDITDIIQVEKILSNFHPSLIINAAAYTNVDGAESEKTLAFKVNREGPANLAKACAKAKIPLIHISTDYIFDGRKGMPYIETDPVSPTGVYGKSKEQGEAEVRSHLNRHIILRTAWLYGIHGHNFVKTMLKLGKEKKIIKVVADQYGCPTSADDLAETVLIIADRIRNGSKIKWGTYHYCGHGITTWHKFAKTIFEISREYDSMENPMVEPVTTSEYPTKAKRPAFSALDCSLIHKNFGISVKPWQESLKRTIRALKNI
ncbi:MAG: dTDP-4-dehydrorhamnose reductase [Deltaproteobacteria bacterium]|nr:dTDP-4-dehydrorhamnose reductase [Deltaproteobacteria bacterium]